MGNWAWETSLDSYLAGGGRGRGAGEVPVCPGRAHERQEGVEMRGEEGGWEEKREGEGRGRGERKREEERRREEKGGEERRREEKSSSCSASISPAAAAASASSSSLMLWPFDLEPDISSVCYERG